MIDKSEKIKCVKCKISQDRSRFYRNDSKSNGLESWCKNCKRERSKRWREENHARYRELTYKSKRKHYRKYQQNHAEDIAVRKVLNNAIRDGKVQRKPCEVCGKAKVEAHHADYRKPLSVNWLCITHHKAWHRIFEVVRPDKTSEVE